VSPGATAPPGGPRREPSPPDVSLWRDPPFRRLWAGQTISALGSTISREALPLTAVLLLSATPMQVSLLAAAGSATSLIFGVPAGLLADRMRRRLLMICADLARAALLLLIPLAAALGRLDLALLLVVSFLVGAWSVLFDVAYPSYVPQLVPGAQLVEANSKLEVGDSLAEIGGAALGGAMVQFLGGPLAILVDAFSFVASALSLAVIGRREPAPLPNRESTGLLREALAGWRWVRHQPTVRALAGATGFFYFFGGFFGALYVLFAIQELSIPPAILGLLIAAGGVGALLGAATAERASRRIGIGRTAILAFWARSATALLTPLAPAVAPWGALFLFTGQLAGDFALMIFFISELSLRQSLAPAAILGRVNASMELIAAGLSPFGLLAAGIVAEALGLRPALLVGVLGSALGGVWLLRSPLRQISHLPQSRATS
jgi:predicted MFS family arabinose efflux permease